MPCLHPILLVLSDLVFNPSVFVYAIEVLFVFKYDSINFVLEPNLHHNGKIKYSLQIIITRLAHGSTDCWWYRGHRHYTSRPEIRRWCPHPCRRYRACPRRCPWRRHAWARPPRLERDLPGGLLRGVARRGLLLALELPLLYPWIFLRRKNSRSCSSSSPRM